MTAADATADDDRVSLDEALLGARAAERASRIQWRDRIARHGVDAIEAMTQWAADPEYGAFAVRVIEAVARFGERDAAIAALASVLRVAPTASIRGDVEDALARLRPSAPRLTSPRSTVIRLPREAGWSWPGFKPTDFGQITGTTWRRRTDPIALVPLVLRPLLERDSGFTTAAIYGSPEVHIADRDRYSQGGEWKQGWRASKLVVYTHGPNAEHPDNYPRVAAGWYLEKGTGTDEYGPVEATHWDWPLFMDLLNDSRRRAVLEEATSKHQLRIGDYVGGRFAPEGAAVGWIAALEDDQLVMRDRVGAVVDEGWSGLVRQVSALPSDVWHDLHVWREWPADTAIEMGQPFATRELVPVMVDLADVYLDVIGRGRP